MLAEGGARPTREGVTLGSFCAILFAAMPARLHFLSGAKADVAQDPDAAARMLWGKKDGDDAHDMGYAALHLDVQGDTKTILLNPAAVAYVEAAPDKAFRSP